MEIKEKMENLPNELVKVRQEINETVDIYRILEEFNHKFTKEDLNKKWMIFGGPKEVLELMDTRQNSLEKDKVRFLDVMKAEQEEFA